MFCLYCKSYQGLDKPCKQGTHVTDIQEVLICEHYEYNGSVTDES